MRFKTTLQLEGRTATGFRVPPEVVEALGRGKRPPVTVTLNGAYTYRSTIAPYGDVYMLGVAAEHREVRERLDRLERERAGGLGSGNDG